MTLPSYRPTTIRALDSAGFDTIIDVRAPSEYAQDHVPGAINLPVLSDAERAQVGTIYKQDSPFAARKLGAALVARNAAHHLQTALAAKPGSWQPLVYCWRGGQRSGSFATILSQIGWRVSVLDGGYKCWRALVGAQVYDTPFPAPVVLLSGGTGTGKTDILHHAAAHGAQVIDLEGMAEHRGSVFGGTTAQPSQKLFETRLAMAIAALDPARPVLIEAESNRIGSIRLPPALWDAMRSASVIEISAPLPARAAYIGHRYADIAKDPAFLEKTLDGLRKYHAAAQVQAWQAMAAQPARLAQSLIAEHYDPRYACVSRTPSQRHQIALRDLSPEALEQAARQVFVTLAQMVPKS